MIESKPRVLYFFPLPSSFIEKDLKILSERYEVVSRKFQPSKKYLLPLHFFTQFIFLLFDAKASLIITRFAGYHSFLPALLGKTFSKPVLIIVGGMDAHCFPSIGYGNYTKKIYGWFTRKSLEWATHISPLDETLVECDYTYLPEKFSRQGYKSFCPEASAPFTVIHNGYDTTDFFPDTSVRREPNSFITVSGNINGRDFYLKGIDLIIEAAKHFPDLQFTVIARHDKVDVKIFPQNVKLISAVPYHELMDYYCAHEFYFQLSMAEGFPNALCEAMLCECIPIGSGVFSIPKIIGDSGFVLRKKDVTELTSLISQALQSEKSTLSARAHKRISEAYPLTNRKDLLLKLVDSLIKVK